MSSQEINALNQAAKNITEEKEDLTQSDSTPTEMPGDEPSQNQSQSQVLEFENYFGKVPTFSLGEPMTEKQEKSKIMINILDAEGTPKSKGKAKISSTNAFSQFKKTEGDDEQTDEEEDPSHKLADQALALTERIKKTKMLEAKQRKEREMEKRQRKSLVLAKAKKDELLQGKSPRKRLRTPPLEALMGEEIRKEKLKDERANKKPKLEIKKRDVIACNQKGIIVGCLSRGAKKCTHGLCCVCCPIQIKSGNVEGQCKFHAKYLRDFEVKIKVKEGVKELKTFNKNIIKDHGPTFNALKEKPKEKELSKVKESKLQVLANPNSLSYINWKESRAMEIQNHVESNTIDLQSELVLRKMRQYSGYNWTLMREKKSQTNFYFKDGKEPVKCKFCEGHLQVNLQTLVEKENEEKVVALDHCASCCYKYKVCPICPIGEQMRVVDRQIENATAIVGWETTQTIVGAIMREQDETLNVIAESALLDKMVTITRDNLEYEEEKQKYLETQKEVEKLRKENAKLNKVVRKSSEKIKQLGTAVLELSKTQASYMMDLTGSDDEDEEDKKD